MNSLKLMALSAVMALAACGSREWRGVQTGKVVDVNAKAVKKFEADGFNPQDPNNVELLKSIGGASLRVNPETTEGNGVLTVVLKNCEQLSKEVSIKDGKAFAEVTNSKNSGNAHSSFETRCFGENDSCDQVAVMITSDLNGNKGQAVISFSKNQYGNYSVNETQYVGVMVSEADQFLAQRNERCEVQAKDTTIARDLE